MKKYWKILIGTLLGVVLLYFALRDMNWQEFQEHVQQMRVGVFSLGLLVMLSSHYARGYRWVLFIKGAGEQARYTDAFWAVMAGYMANNAIPRGGELFRCTLLAQSNKVSFATAFGTVVVERAFDLLILIAIFLLLLFTAPQEFQNTLLSKLFPKSTSHAWVLPMGITILAIAFFVLLWQRYKSRWLHVPLIAKIHAFFAQMVKAIVSVKHLPNPTGFVVSTIIIWAFYILSVWFMLLGLPQMPDHSLYFAALLLVIGGFGIVAPSPGGIGTYHWMVIITFLAMGYSKSDGQIYGTLSHITQYLMNTFVGFVGYLWLVWKARHEERT